MALPDRKFTAFKDENRARAFLEFCRDDQVEVELNLDIPGIARIDHLHHDPQVIANELLGFNAAHPHKKCDLCSTVLGPTHVDGRTDFGCWANMCEGCFTDVGVGLGTGKGQRFETFTMKKVAG